MFGKTCWFVGVALVLCSVAAMAQDPAEHRNAVDVGTVAAPGEYWLGIGCMPVLPPLRAQLSLPEKQGLLVGNVAPDSPAAKAGILRYDILLRVGDKPLAEPRDLVQAIEAAKEGKLKIEILRGGKPKTIEATPAKRPEDARRRMGPAPDPRDRETMEKWLEGMWPSGSPDGGPDGERPPLRFRFIHPGAIVPRDSLMPALLPPNTSVVISREGDQPAKITVKRGEQKWEVTEKELDKLPADVRPHVERMLGHGPLGIVGGLSPSDFVPNMVPNDDISSPDPAMKPPRGLGLPERLEKRFDEMNRRMDKLFEEVERLHGGHGQQKPAK